MKQWTTHAMTIARRVTPGPMLLLACAFALMASAMSGCVDFGIPEEQFLCRNQAECGEGYACLRGPGCYCVCKAFDSSAEPNCSDPNCENVTVQQ